MTARAPKPGLADYLAMAVGPLLIMVLVGSFAFFLLDVFYRGEHLLRVRWTLFWFVLACVLVSRISIEIDLGRASLYGFVLAGATSLMLMRYVDFLPGVLALLALIWWLAHRLTWNCTLIDDNTEDPEGGLLAGVGLGPHAAGAGTEAGRLAANAACLPPMNTAGASLTPGGGIRATAARPAPSRRRRESGQPPPHAPGLWILYSGLFTLPVFALGEAILPRTDAVLRAAAFGWLRLHVAAAVSLLLVTSFLSLRRHLRRRHLEMSPTVFIRWSACGVVLMAGLLAAATLLPRPAAFLHAPGVAGSLRAPEPGTFERRRQASTDPRAGQTSAAEADRGQPASPPEGENRRTGKAESGAQPESGAGRRASGDEPMAAAPAVPPGTAAAEWGLLRNILRAVLIVGLIGLTVRFRTELWRGLVELLESLRRLLSSTAAPVAPLHPAAGAGARRTVPRPANPFATGMADAWSVERVVQETFDRLRARDLDLGKAGSAEGREETPWEFAARLAANQPELAADLLPVAQAYMGLAYGGRPPAEPIRDHCVALWGRMQS